MGRILSAQSGSYATSLTDSSLAKSSPQQPIREFGGISTPPPPPPQGPHFGGLHEALVKSAKRAIVAVIGNADITDRRGITVNFCWCGGAVEFSSIDVQVVGSTQRATFDAEPFLFGTAGGCSVPTSVDSTDFSLRKRWRYVQRLIQHSWRRWMREVVPALNNRPLWQPERRNVQVSDVVLVISEDTPRGQWPIGRVTKVFRGTDGHVRVVKVQVGERRFTCPITRLCSLVEH